MAAPVLVNDSETKIEAGGFNMESPIPLSVSLRDSKYSKFEESILKSLKPDYLFDNPVLEIDTEKVNVFIPKINDQNETTLELVEC
ncbi:hypothetical protein P8452_59405 [Trifolium repens]|nr:hypothetical protein P8452_59405 [Trifolium repens]